MPKRVHRASSPVACRYRSVTCNILTHTAFEITELAFDEEAFLSGHQATSSSASTSCSENRARSRPSEAYANRSAGNSGLRTYGSRPTKRRRASTPRPCFADASPAPNVACEVGGDLRDEAPAPGIAADSGTERPAAGLIAKQKKKRLPSFWLDIPPWPIVPRPAGKPAPVSVAEGGDDASTHPSVLSAASLARREAARRRNGTRVSMSATLDAPARVSDAAGALAAGREGPDRVVIGVAVDADCDPRSPLPRPVHESTESGDRSGTFEHLLAQVASAAAEGPAVEEPVSFDALMALAPLGDGGNFGTQAQVDVAISPRQASFVEQCAGIAGHRESGGAAAAAIEQEVGPLPSDPDELTPGFDTGGFAEVPEQADMTTFDLSPAQLAPVSAACAVNPPGLDAVAEFLPERFPTPSSLTPSFVEVRTLLGSAAARQTDFADEAAFRMAMRQQWPRTVL